MTANNPFLPLTKTGIHRAQVAPKREGLFLSFIENLFSDWALHVQSVEKEVKTRAKVTDIGGEDLIEIDEIYIKKLIAELDDREKRHLLDFFKVQAAQFIRMLNIIENLMHSIAHSEYKYWGGNKQIFRKTLSLPNFEYTLEERLQTKLSAMNRVTRILLNELNKMNPKFLTIDTDIENFLDRKTMKGADVELLKSTALKFATDEMRRIEGLVAEFKPTKVSLLAKPSWPQLDSKRIVLATIGAALLGCAIFVGINCIPAVGQAISLILAMSVVNSFLMTSFVGLGVGGLLSLTFALTHIYLAAKQHYKPPVKVEEFSFSMQIAPGYEPPADSTPITNREWTPNHSPELSHASAEVDDTTPHDSTEFDTSDLSGLHTTSDPMNFENASDCTPR